MGMSHIGFGTVTVYDSSAGSIPVFLAQVIEVIEVVFHTGYLGK